MILILCGKERIKNMSNILWRKTVIYFGLSWDEFKRTSYFFVLHSEVFNLKNKRS